MEYITFLNSVTEYVYKTIFFPLIFKNKSLYKSNEEILKISYKNYGFIKTFFINIILFISLFVFSIICDLSIYYFNNELIKIIIMTFALYIFLRRFIILKKLDSTNILLTFYLVFAYLMMFYQTITFIFVICYKNIISYKLAKEDDK